jgi:hypothetical protein
LTDFLFLSTASSISFILRKHDGIIRCLQHRDRERHRAEARALAQSAFLHPLFDPAKKNNAQYFVRRIAAGWLAGEHNSNPQAGYLGRIARTAFPRWWGLSAPRTCAGGLLLRWQVGEHAIGPRRVSRSSFSVNLEGVGSGGVKRLLTAPRRIRPGAVVSTGPCGLIFLGGSQAALQFR